MIKARCNNKLLVKLDTYDWAVVDKYTQLVICRGTEEKARRFFDNYVAKCCR